MEGREIIKIKDMQIKMIEKIEKRIKEFLDKNMYMFLTLMLVFYSMWCVDESNITKFNNKLIYTVPILMIIAMKYSFNIENSAEGDPVEVLLSDKVLIILVLLFIFTMGVIVLI